MSIEKMFQLKGYTDNKFIATQKLRFVSVRIEYTAGRRQKCWFPVFSLFPQGLQRFSLPRLLKLMTKQEGHDGPGLLT